MALVHTLGPHRRAVLTTDASSIVVAAILTQPDDEGRQHHVAYESRNYQAHVLELLVVVHALRVFRVKHYRHLLGSGHSGVGPTVTCGRTTRRSRGSRRTGS